MKKVIKLMLVVTSFLVVSVSLCGCTFIEQLFECQHKWSEYTTTTSATCITTGLKERSCSICGEKEELVIDFNMSSHQFGETQDDVEATCTTEGSKIKTCKNCGFIDGEVVSKKAHSYGEWQVVNEATCNENGSEKKVCSGCDHEVFQEIAAHCKWDDGVFTVEPTCTTEGEKFYSCTVCGNTKEEEVSALGHTVGTTYLLDDFKHWKICSTCNLNANEVVHNFDSYGDCSTCSFKNVGTHGLTYTLINNETEYEVSGRSLAVSTVIIPKTFKGIPVTTIAKNAFANNANITSVQLPESIITIKDFAFNFTKINTITIPKSVKTIGSNAFSQSIFKSIIFEEKSSLVSLGTMAFRYCDELEEITLPNGVVKIESQLFQHCEKLKKIYFSDNITSIESHAFDDCILLKEISLPSKLTYIGDFAFQNCETLTTITIPKSVNEIGVGAFADAGFNTIIFTLTSGWKQLNASSTNWNSVSVSNSNNNALYMTSSGLGYYNRIKRFA